MKYKIKYAFSFFIMGIGISIGLGILWLFGIASMSFTYEPLNLLLSYFPAVLIFLPFFVSIFGYIYGDKKNQETNPLQQNQADIPKHTS